MVLNLCKAFFRIKSNLLYINCSVNNVRNVHSLRFTPESFKYSKLTIFKENIFKIKRSFTFLPCRRQLEKVNLNVVNNVLIFKYENNRYFNLLTCLAAAQLLLFFGISWALLPILPPRRKDQSLLNYIMTRKLPVALIATPIIAGVLGPFLMYVFITRSVKYIILHKGGQKVTVVTQHVFGKPSQITLPTNKVSVNKTREDLVKYMSVKLADIPLYFIVHKEGTFVNPELFDHSIAFRRPGS